MPTRRPPARRKLSATESRSRISAPPGEYSILYSYPGVFCVMKDLDPGKEILQAAGIAMLSLMTCLLLLLPAAWCITQGWITKESSVYCVFAAAALSAFTVRKLYGSPQGRGEILRAFLRTGIFYALLILLTAGMRNAVLSPLRLLPYAGCSFVGELTAMLTKNNKKYSIKKRKRVRHYR